MILEFLVLVGLLVGAEKNSKKEFDVIIEGPIRDLSDQSKTIIDGVRSGKKKILVKINSPGGGIAPSAEFIESLIHAESQGTTVACVVDGEAYSAALLILSTCHERYALYGSRVMFHTARISGEFTIGPREAAMIFNHLTMLNQGVWTIVRESLPPAYFEANFEAERLIPVSEIELVSQGKLLKVIKSLDEIKK